MGVVHVSLQTEDSEAFEQLGLVDHSIEVVRVVQNTALGAISMLVLLTGIRIS